MSEMTSAPAGKPVRKERLKSKSIANCYILVHAVLLYTANRQLQLVSNTISFIYLFSTNYHVMQVNILIFEMLLTILARTAGESEFL